MGWSRPPKVGGSSLRYSKENMRNHDGVRASVDADLSVCDRCHGISRLQHCAFYCYVKGEGVYEGDFCLSCMSKIVLQSTFWNLIFGIWTVWGLFVGPIFVLINAVRYFRCVFRFSKD